MEVLFVVSPFNKREIDENRFLSFFLFLFLFWFQGVVIRQRSKTEMLRDSTGGIRARRTIDQLLLYYIDRYYKYIYKATHNYTVYNECQTQ